MGSKIVLLLACSIVAGCATTADMQPVAIGHGNYELAGTGATAYSSGGTEKVKLLRAANAYCAKQNKQATVVQADATNAHTDTTLFAPRGILTRTGIIGGEHATADVVFQCQ